MSTEEHCELLSYNSSYAQIDSLFHTDSITEDLLHVYQPQAKSFNIGDKLFGRASFFSQTQSPDSTLPVLDPRL